MHQLDDLIGDLIANSSNPTVGVLAHPGQVDVRIAAKAADTEDAKRLIAPIEDEVRKLLGRHVFAVDDETMEDVVGKLLRERDMSIATYEDLSGGTVADQVREAAGELFLQGFISNSMESLDQFAKAGDETPPFTNGKTMRGKRLMLQFGHPK